MTCWERASSDPDFEFQMLDGTTECYISRKTGAVIFEEVGSHLSPVNVAFIVRFLERNPEAKAFIKSCLE